MIGRVCVSRRSARAFKALTIAPSACSQVSWAWRASASRSRMDRSTGRPEGSERDASPIAAFHRTSATGSSEHLEARNRARIAELSEDVGGQLAHPGVLGSGRLEDGVELPRVADLPERPDGVEPGVGVAPPRRPSARARPPVRRASRARGRVRRTGRSSGRLGDSVRKTRRVSAASAASPPPDRASSARARTLPASDGSRAAPHFLEIVAGPPPLEGHLVEDEKNTDRRPHHEERQQEEPRERAAPALFERSSSDGSSSSSCDDRLAPPGTRSSTRRRSRPKRAGAARSPGSSSSRCSWWGRRWVSFSSST